MNRLQKHAAFETTPWIFYIQYTNTAVKILTLISCSILSEDWLRTGVPVLANRLLFSLTKAYQFFDNSRVAWKTVFVLLVVHSGLLMYSAYVHSPTLNEPAHLVAGLSHWKFGRFELYRVNPPLVRMVAALPVMAVGYEEDWSGFYEGPGARPVFGMGEDFVAANRERTFFLTMIARWACMPFSWLGAVICYLWARDLYGRPAGLLACFIWCFEPNILAHASLITPDAHSTALGVAACYTFWRWLKKPTWTQAALTGVVLGLAELAKTTLILFYPLWPLLWIVYRWQDRATMTVRAWGREAGMLALRMAIGLYIVNLGYEFEGSFKPLGEFHFVSQLFTENTRSGVASDSRPANCFSNTPASLLPVPLPKNYLLGIDIQQKDFESYGRPSYLRGEWRDHGWWYYYIYAGLVKSPLGLLVAGGIALLSMPWQRFSTPARDTLILLTPPVVVFCVVSSKTGFNEHFRYALPAFPFIFIWIAGSSGFFTKNVQGVRCTARSTYVKGLSTQHARALLSASLRCWIATSSLWIYPHSLSYFNELIGGPLNGGRHLMGSNVDWGQDVLYAKRLLIKIKSPKTVSFILNTGYSEELVFDSHRHDITCQLKDGELLIVNHDALRGSGGNAVCPCGNAMHYSNREVIEFLRKSPMQAYARLGYTGYLLCASSKDPN